MDNKTETVIRSYYKETTCGYVCTLTEDEYIELAKDLEAGRELALQETRNPATIDISKGYVFAALQAGEVVFEPVIVLCDSRVDSK